MKSQGHKYEYWNKYSKINNYYYENFRKLAAKIIPSDASVLEFGSKRGELLKYLPNKIKVGVEFDPDFKNNKSIKVIYYKDIRKVLKGKKFDYILLSNTLSEIDNIQDFLSVIKKYCHERTRIVSIYFNYLWKPLLDLGEIAGVKSPEYKVPNWLTREDVDNFFDLERYEKIKHGKYFLIPYKIPFFSDAVNKYLSPLPFFRELSLLNYSVYKFNTPIKDYSVSIVVPARNESGNIKGVLNKIPTFPLDTEVIFVEGNSSDYTYEAIDNEMKNYKGNISTKLYKQKGKGKGDAVRLGFSNAKNDLLMILDADLTVRPEELTKFYDAVKIGKGELVMGSRLIYPMENEAMRTLNILGNKFFSSLFSFVLDQRIKDTLCGTKVLLKKDYQKIVENRKVFGDFDPFGDYDLIFGAAKLNLKISEIPIRYRDRIYGTTNISRFTHGWLLLKMSYFALKKFKFI